MDFWSSWSPMLLSKRKKPKLQLPTNNPNDWGYFSKVLFRLKQDFFNLFGRRVLWEKWTRPMVYLLPFQERDGMVVRDNIQREQLTALALSIQGFRLWDMGRVDCYVLSFKNPSAWSGSAYGGKPKNSKTRIKKWGMSSADFSWQNHLFFSIIERNLSWLTL